MALGGIEAQALVCKKCKLWLSRKKVVFGSGSLKPRVMLIGEAPGFNEDLRGKPFVGSAGKFLDELLIEAGLSRDGVYITNVVKCRPPDNRDPEREEIDSCSFYLDRQIELLSPEVIVTLGRISTFELLGRYGIELNARSISMIHGAVFEADGLKIVPSYHPAAAIYRNELKGILKSDFRRIGQLLRGSRQTKLPI
jgi:DNA polymerase